MRTPWDVVTDKELQAHFLKAPRGWLKQQAEAAGAPGGPGAPADIPDLRIQEP